MSKLARTFRKGWIPDLPDHRDFIYSAPYRIIRSLPPRVDLRPWCPPVYDQLDLGSCTANAIAGAVQFERQRQSLVPPFVPSRLFLYYNERAMEGTINSDAGASIRDGLKSVASQGDCPETEWPYDVNQFTTKPPDVCYKWAVHYRTTSYESVSQTLQQMKGCLASGFPFVFGFTVFESFESDKVAANGVVPMPGPNENVLGGHAVMAVGYIDKYERFIVRNSWGHGWGAEGYCYMPYRYLSDPNLSGDFWCVKLEGG